MLARALVRTEGAATAVAVPHLSIRSVVKRFGDAVAVDRVSLDLARGEFVALLGDSGCGKTTLLRIVAGFTAADGGAILRGGTDITALPAVGRGMGFVFQSYALFPTKTVAANIGFALTVARRPKTEIARRIEELAGLVDIAALLGRFPHELSGGQQQRVALARALAAEPDVLLLDEPMSALDARIRGRLRTELRALINRLGITTLYVTHDQEEAMAMADRVAVMRRGRIEQIGAPAEIYHRPLSRFVADFVGVANVVEGVAADGGLRAFDRLWPAAQATRRPAGTPVTAIFRPERLTIGNGGLPGRVLSASFRGAVARLDLLLDCGATIVVDVPSSPVPGEVPARGDSVGLVVPPDAAHLLPPDAAQPTSTQPTHTIPAEPAS